MDTRSLVRLGVLGTLMLCALITAPMGLRAWFGTISLGYLISCVVIQTAMGAISIASLLFVFQRARLRGLAIRGAVITALAFTVPVMSCSYLVQLALVRAFPDLVETDPNEPQSVEFAVASSLADSVPALVLFAGLVFFPAVLHAEDERRRELEALRREADILRLRSHLEPHFVVNTLNAVAGFVTESPEEARALLAALGELFGEASRFEPRHPVADELRWLERYLEIHTIRFGDSLRVTWDVSREVRGLTCPALIAQPLVENALQHGALRRPQGHLHVVVALRGEHLVFEIQDDGPGLGPRRAGGQGLALVERRVVLEGGPGARFSIDRVGDHTIATVKLAREAA